MEKNNLQKKKHLNHRRFKLFAVLLFIGVTGLMAQTATQPEGSGTESAPYLITSLENLCWLSQTDSIWDDTLCFEQTADIDASDTRYWNISDGDTLGFTPIGNFDIHFTGSFNGSGHTINNLYINRDSFRVGLFGSTYGAKIDSLGLINCDVSGDIFVGGLVGLNDMCSIISNSYSIGNVSGTSDVGGLVGTNDSSEVFNCYSAGYVTGDEYIGGLTGDNYTYSTISNCYSTVSVVGNYSIGGLAGFNASSSEISNSYNTGSVSGGELVGGLVGTNFYSAKILNSYNTGRVLGESYLAGLVGFNSSSTISNSYFNSETSGVNSGTGYDNNGQTVKDLTIIQLKNADNFSNWNFDTVWDIHADTTYPALRLVDNAPFVFSDTITGSLSALLQNDYDYETLQENLVVRVDSAILLPDGVNYTDSLTSLVNGGSIKIVYRAGEMRSGHSNTLYSGAITSYLKIDNTAPVISDTLQATEELQLALTSDLLATDSDDDVLFFTLLNSTDNGQLSFFEDDFTYRPDANFYGIDSFKIRVSDQLSISEGWIYINVENVNDAPVIASRAGTEAVVSEKYTYIVDASDVDGDALTYSLANKPIGMEVSSEGVVTWIPENGTTTSGEVTLNVSDGELIATESFTVTVTERTGIEGAEIEPMTLYPNPAYETIYLKGFEGIATVYLYNSQGQLEQEKQVAEGQGIYIANLSKGIYLVKIELRNRLIIKTIIKTE